MARGALAILLAGCAPLRADGALADAAEHIDAAHANVSDRVQDLARWVDAFFSDNNYSEEADAYLELAQQVTLARSESPGRRTRARARVTLPALSRRLSLAFLGNNEADTARAAPSVSTDPRDEPRDSSTLALEFFPRRNERMALSLGGGLRFSDQSAYAGPRLRYEGPVGERWHGRLIERLRYRFGSGIESVSSAEVERGLPGGGFCRERLSIVWEAANRDDPGIRSTFTSACTLAPRDRNGLRFAWATAYQSRPRAGFTSTRISATWRRFIRRRWLFVQLTPFIAWEDRFDWRTRPGLQATVGIVFDGDGGTTRAEGDAPGEAPGQPTGDRSRAPPGVNCEGAGPRVPARPRTQCAG